MTKQELQNIKFDLLDHFINHKYDILLNPHFVFEIKPRYSYEEEMLITMFIQTEMPYLTLFEKNNSNDVIISLTKEIKSKDLLFYYKESYKELSNRYSNFLNKLENVIEEF